MAQSKTAVNAKASAAEPMQKYVDGSVIPGGSGGANDLGGPTPENYKSTDDSAKIGTGAPGQSKTAINDKASSAGDMAAQPTVSPSVVPGGGSADGTNSGRGAGAQRPTVGKEASYEHVEVDRQAAEHLEALAEDQDASDEFKMKAKVIFEGALNQKLQIEVARLEEEFSSRFEQEITDIAEKVEAFLNYTSQQWLEENKLVVENGIRNELSESFMGGLKSLFEDHYVTLPDEKYDIFESMVAKLDDMEDKLNEQIEANVSMASQMSGFQREQAIADVSWDLSEAAKEKLASLAENVEFESDENYRQKLSILKESFVEAPAQQEQLSESAEALQPTAEEGMSATMAAYAQALSRTI